MPETIDRVCSRCQSLITVVVDSEGEPVDGGYFIFTASEDVAEEWMEPNQLDTGEVEIWECSDCYDEDEDG